MIPMEEKENKVQDEVLEMYKNKGSTITVYLTRGNRITGKVIGYDKYTILLDVDGQHNLIYKHAISTIIAEGK